MRKDLYVIFRDVFSFLTIIPFSALPVLLFSFIPGFLGAKSCSCSHVSVQFCQDSAEQEGTTPG